MRRTSQGRVTRAAAAGLLAITLAGAAAACDERPSGLLATAPGACADSTTTSVTMAPATATLAIGDSVRVNASLGCTGPGTFRFSSTNPGVATVNASTGTVRALAVGDATIIATSSVNPLVQGTTTIAVR
ncbi:MAG TPA: Ig-like domain-containing protein [Gemmatimonadaceae bacterium]